MTKVGTINEYYCDTCTPCPRCHIKGARIHSIYGVSPCKKCSAKIAKQTAIPLSHHQFGTNRLREYAATPFWKHMGLKPKPEEVFQEKVMKAKGMTYADLAVARNAGRNARFHNHKLVNQALEGKLPDGPKTPHYRKQRATSQPPQKTN